MSTEHLIATGTFMIVVTAVILIAAAIMPRAKFNPVKVLNLKPGVYQNRSNGNLIEVRAFNGNKACVVSQTGIYNISYDVLDANYAYVGEL